MKSKKPLFVTKDSDSLIVSGVDLTEVISFSVQRLPGLINVNLVLPVGGYIVSLKTEAELEQFLAKLQSIVDCD
jgi:hypothetical protein